MRKTFSIPWKFLAYLWNTKKKKNKTKLHSFLEILARVCNQLLTLLIGYAFSRRADQRITEKRETNTVKYFHCKYFRHLLSNVNSSQKCKRNWNGTKRIETCVHTRTYVGKCHDTFHERDCRLLLKLFHCLGPEQGEAVSTNSLSLDDERLHFNTAGIFLKSSRSLVADARRSAMPMPPSRFLRRTRHPRHFN